MAPTPTWTSERARVAVNSRHHGPHAPSTLEARRDLRAACLGDFILRTVAAAPALTIEQRSRLAQLLSPAVGDTS